MPAPLPPRRKKKAEPLTTPVAGKVQPQAVDVECVVLGALMLEKDAYSEVSEMLKPEIFYDHRHQLIYQAIQKLAMDQKPIDILTVADELSKDGTLDEIGGPVYIAQLTGNVSSAAHIEYHSKIIVQKALARDLINYAGNIEANAFDETTDIPKLMQEAEAQLFNLSQNNIRKDYQPISTLLPEAINKIEQASHNTSGMTGIPTGFTELDAMTSGWQNSDLVIIAARPAMGKTAFALSMCKNMAVDYNTPVAIFSLEMSNLQLVNRLIQNVCEIEGSKIKSGKLSSDEITSLTARTKVLAEAKIFVDDTPSLSVFELRTKARRLVREKGVRCIMIDYLQLMNASGMSFQSREQEVSTISRSLKGLAKELNIPILALSQLNRSVETRDSSRQGDGKRPQLSDLRESGAIEQDADMVLFIHRPEYYKIFEDEKGNDLRGLAEIIIAKHRNGAVGDVRLRFRGEYVRFQNLTAGDPLESKRRRKKDATAESQGGEQIMGSKLDGSADYPDSDPLADGTGTGPFGPEGPVPGAPF